MFCQNCGQSLSEDAKFCANCGFSVSAAANRPDQPAQPVQPIQPVQEVQASQPVQPVQPIQPVQEVQASQPVQTVQPAQPIQPVQPVQPEQPTQPTPPVQEVQPTVQPPYAMPPIQPVYAQPMPPAKPKKKRTGLLVGVIISAAIIVALVIFVAVGGGSCSFTTANLANAAMASKVDQTTQQAVTITDTFATNTAIIYATALLKNAPEDTVITAKWYFVTDNLEIASVDIKSTEISQYVVFSLSKPTNGFPTGDYKVELYIDGKLNKTLTFKVK
jgi:hypothetical protein